METGTLPRGIRWAKILVELLAEQEGVEIPYRIEQDGEVVTGTTAH